MSKVSFVKLSNSYSAEQIFMLKFTIVDPFTNWNKSIVHEIFYLNVCNCWRYFCLEEFLHKNKIILLFPQIVNLKGRLISFWYLSICHYVFGIFREHTKIILPLCSQIKLRCLHCKLPFDPISNSWITSQLSEERGGGERREEERRRHWEGTQDSNVDKHLPLKRPRLKPKRVRAGKTCICGRSVSKRQAISDLCCDGTYQTQKHIQKLDRIFWSPYRQLLIKMAKPYFFV